MSKTHSFSNQQIRTFWWGAGAFISGLFLTYLLGLYQQSTQKQGLQDLLNKESQVLVGQTQRRINLYITTLRSGAEVLDKGYYETFSERFLLFCQSQRFQNTNTGINEFGFIPALTTTPPTPQNVISQLCSVQDGVLIKYNTEQPVNPALFKILSQPIGEGQVIASPYFKLTFRPSSPEAEGQIFYYPIGNYDPSSKTKMVGNPKLIGWLFLTLRKSFFADGLRFEHNPDLQVRLEMIGSSSVPDTLIYESSIDVLKDADKTNEFRTESTIPVAGRVWKLTTGFSQAYVSDYLRAGQRSLWIAGFSLSLLAGLLIAILRMRYLSQTLAQIGAPESKLKDQHLLDSNEENQPSGKSDSPITLEKTDELVVEEFDVQSFVTDLADSSQLSQDELWSMASVDAITELPNKLLFMDRLALELRRAKRDNHLFGLLIFSLDNFSEIQSGYGDKVTNRVLKVIATKTQQILRSTDTVGYLSENQFGVLIAQQHSIQHLTRIAYKVYESQPKKIQVSGRKVPIAISFGLSVYPEDGGESEALIENALYALNESNKQGGDRLTFYSQPLEEATGQRRILVQEIRKAIDSKQLFVRFQPVVDLETGVVAKAEALIRWESPEKGEIKPQEFIDIAEDAGLIVEIGNFVFSETVGYLRKWKKVLPSDFQVSINISPQQLRLSKELAKEWRAILLEKEVSGQSIVLEITEGILLQDDRQIIQSIYELREAGIRFCLDDFGTGYSSISYLKKLDIDYLKVDQSFVRDLNNNEEDQKIVEGILLLAKKMGMKSIAEGIETKAQLKCLQEFGCEYGQGFYFARAMMPDEFIEWAKERFK